MFYLDTSLLVTALTLEPETDVIQRWLATQLPDETVISDWVMTEFSAALSIKIRSRQLDADGRSRALSEFSAMTKIMGQIYPVSAHHFRTATQLANQYALGVRAGDALHLAIASDYSATLVTRDRKLAEAASTLGIAAQFL